MKFSLKTYKISKIKYIVKTNSLFFVFMTTMNNKNWVISTKKLGDFKISFYKLSNRLVNYTLRQSLLRNSIHLIKGPLVIITPADQKNSNFTLKLMNPPNFKLSLFCMKLNNNIYPLSQLNMTVSLNYVVINIKFYCFLKNVCSLF